MYSRNRQEINNGIKLKAQNFINTYALDGKHTLEARNSLEITQEIKPKVDHSMKTTRDGIENSKCLNTARAGKQLRLKKNFKKASTRYKGSSIENEESKAKSHSRSRPRRQQHKLNTSLVVNRNNLRQNFFPSTEEREDKKSNGQDKPSANIKFALKKVNDGLVNSYRQPIVVADDISQIDDGGALNVSQSEAVPVKQKAAELKTVEVKEQPKLNSLTKVKGLNTIVNMKA